MRIYLAFSFILPELFIAVKRANFTNIYGYNKKKPGTNQ